MSSDLGHERSLAELAGKRALAVASTGGHLAQAVRWQSRLGLSADSMFVTFENAQSTALLARKPHAFVPYVKPRDWLGVARTGQEILRLQRHFRADALVSTG